MSWSIREGDCIEVMRELDESSVDAVVTDPPYGLEFMGKEWDGIGRRISHPLDPSMQIERDAPDDPRPERGPWKNERTGYGAPRKNARCRRCGCLRWTANPCDCPAPDWDTRTSEYAGVMQAWHTVWAVEVRRVLKPGGHLLAFGGTRTYHRLACALEDAGFEIRDCLTWLYGSGFPKSLDVSKAIDKAAGVEREVVGIKGVSSDFGDHAGSMMSVENSGGRNQATTVSVTAPATPDAERWQGWGTALKPAFEPIVLARKPLAERNVAANVLKHGTGALNVDGTRIGVADGHGGGARATSGFVDGYEHDGFTPSMVGRWPANVVLDEEAARLVDEQTGERRSAYPGRPDQAEAYQGSPVSDNGPVSFGADLAGLSYADSGGASRFFYTAKTSRAEREVGRMYGAERNNHPTVKPVDLMQWLCRLITPPEGLVLDPFTGSGSTGIAALREGFSFLGIERESEYVEIARARIQGDSPLFNLPEEVVAEP